MQIYLMQHGACYPEEVNPEQPLSPVGRESVQATGEALRRMGLWFNAICCSPKIRAWQTAEIIAKATNHSLSRIIETPNLKAMTPPERTLDFVKGLGGEGAVLLTGHLPNLGKLASHLLTGGSGAHVHIENGAITRIDTPSPGTRHGILVYSLLHQQLQLMAGS